MLYNFGFSSNSFIISFTASETPLTGEDTGLFSEYNKLTHVEILQELRGEEWLPSLTKHILLYNYFNWDIPKFIHLPLLLNPDKSKLSKRQGDVNVDDFIAKGYIKECIINFIYPDLNLTKQKRCTCLNWKIKIFFNYQ